MKRIKKLIGILLTTALFITGFNFQVPVVQAATVEVSTYIELSNAITYAPVGGSLEIILTANIEVEGCIYTPEGCNITIHMGSNNLSNTGDCVFDIGEGTVLTLNGPGTVEGINGYYTISNWGSLIVDGASINSDFVAINNFGGNVTLNSGMIGSSQCPNAIYNDSSYPNSIILNGGTIRGNISGLNLFNTDSFTFNGGTVIGGTAAIRSGSDVPITDEELMAKIGDLSRLTTNTTTEKSIVQAIAPSVTTTTASFNKNTPADVSISVNFGVGALGAAGIASVTNNSALLESGTDYTVSGTTLTIKKEYLEDLTPGTTTLTVTFDDDADTTGTAAITVAASTARAITAFSIGSSIGMINEGSHTISVMVPSGTDVRNVTPAISISKYATVSPAISEPNDFTSPVTYTVTTQDGSLSQSYIVTVTVMENVNINADAATDLIYDGTAKAGYASVPTVTKEVGSADVTGEVTLNYTYYTGTEAIPGNQIGSAPTTAGTYTLKISLADTGTKYTAVPKVLSFSIGKATPTIAAIDFPTASDIIYGAVLDSSNFTGGIAKHDSNEVTGTFHWEAGTTIPTVSNLGYAVVFYPTDTINYNNSIPITIPITVGKSTPVVPASPELDSRTVDTITLKPIVVAGYTVEYSYITGSETQSELDSRWQETETFSGLNSKTSYRFYSRIKEGDNNLASAVNTPSAIYTLQEAPAASVITIDYNEETISYDDSAYEVNTSETFIGQAITKDGSIKDLVHNTADTAIYVRGKANGELPAGIVTELTIPARQVVPTQSEVVIDYSNETITYSSDVDVKQTVDHSGVSVVNGSITGLIPDSTGADITLYAYRLATGSAFKSPNLNVSISKRPSFTILPSADEINRKDTSIKLDEIAGAEYRIQVEGIYSDWTQNNEFTGLTPNKEYTFEARLKATASAFASAFTSSNITTKKTIPTITTIPTATGTYGTVLSGMSLQGGVAKVASIAITGIWEWTEANKNTILPTVGTSTGYTVRFTPDASYLGVYDTAEFTVIPTVTERALNITGAIAENRTYNGSRTVNITDVIVDNKVGSDNITITADGMLSSEDAGNYTEVDLSNLVLSGTDRGNYSLVLSQNNVSANVVISKATPIVTMISNKAGDSSVYGEEVSFTATVSGGIIKPRGSIQFTLNGNPYGTPITLTDGLAIFTTTKKQLTPAANNFSVMYIPAIDEINYNGSNSSTYLFTVNKKEVTVKADDISIYVGDVLPLNTSLTYEVTGLLEGDLLIVEPTLTLDNKAVSSAVGSYTITVTGAAAGNNYTVNMVNGRLQISEKPPVAPIATPTPVTSPDKETIEIIGTDNKTFATISNTVKEGNINVAVDVPTETILEEAARNAAKNQQLNITVPISSENLVQQITTNNEVDSIQIAVTMPSAVLADKNIGQVDVKMASKILEAAKETKKDVSVIVADEKGKEQYSWTFTGSELTNSDKKITDVNLSLKVEKANDDAGLKELLKNDASNTETENTYGLVVNFNHEGDLPSQASVKIYVGNLVGASSNSGLTENKKVYLYHYNNATGKLETLPYSSAYQVDKEGYITINILHCSDYVILPYQADNSTITSLRSQIKVTPAKKTLQWGKNTTIKIVLPKTLEQVSSLKEQTSNSAIGAVTVSYTSSNKKVASVNSKGKITANSTGTATITTKLTLYSGKTKTVKTKITVK